MAPTAERGCFLCEEQLDAPLFRVCRCDQLVHEACYRKLLRVPAHATHCAVCCAAYELTHAHAYRLRWTVDSASPRALYGTGLLGGACVLCVVMLIVTGEPIFAPHRWLEWTTRVVFVGLALLTGGLLWEVVREHHRHTRRCCCCALRRVVTRTTVHLPTVEPIVLHAAHAVARAEL